MGGWNYYRSLISGYYIKNNEKYPKFSYIIYLAFDGGYYFNTTPTHPWSPIEGKISKREWYKDIRNLIINKNEIFPN